MARDKIGIGIIGCGDVSLRTYVPGLLGVADRAEVVAVFDADPARAARLADFLEANGAPRPRIVPSLDALLADPEVAGVFNLTPAPLHHEVNMAVLQAGKHLFSEKPLANTLAEARTAIDYARSRDLILLCAPAVMATNRFRWLKHQLSTDWLGRPTLAVGQMANMGPASWREYKGDPTVFYSPAVGPVLDTGVYILHGITGLFGPARRVEAFGGVAIPHRTILIPDRFGEVIEVGAPDHVLIHLDFGDNRFAQVLSSFATPRSRAPALEIHAEGGTVSISQQVWYDLEAPIELWRRDEGPTPVEEWSAVMPTGPSHAVNLIHAGPEHFVAVLEHAEAAILTAEHAAHIMEITFAAAQSMAEGRAVTLSREW